MSGVAALSRIEKEAVMFGKLKKNRLPLKACLFNIRWYPSNRSCVKNAANQKVRPQQMPPLMVRKAEWRR